MLPTNRHFLFCGIVALLAACNSSPSSAPRDTKPFDGSAGTPDDPDLGSADALVSLLGVWKTKCEPYSETQGEIASANFIESQVVIREDIYADAECTQLSFSVFYSYNYKLGDQAAHITTTKAYNIDYVVVKSEASVEDQALADALNAQAAWGFTNWKAGVRQNVSGRRLDPSSAPQDSPGDQSFTIVAVQDGYMVFGDLTTGDGKSPVTRPRQLATGPHWQKSK
jgi:hypothetical protein